MAVAVLALNSFKGGIKEIGRMPITERYRTQFINKHEGVGYMSPLLSERIHYRAL
jgi:hypothetical protein